MFEASLSNSLTFTNFSFESPIITRILASMKFNSDPQNLLGISIGLMSFIYLYARSKSLDSYADNILYKPEVYIAHL